MQLESIPASTQLKITRVVSELASALSKILGDSEPGNLPRLFHSYDIIDGAPFSGRLLFTEVVEKGVKLPYPLNAGEMATAIWKYTSEAGYVREWEIRSTCIAGRPVAIVFCPRK
ncbi:MAG: hypothetical protein G01um101456_641 [Parcubacteria group bacterium Gr01-1014_56]|nr:MAG: hypothetical protein G01um101456_641 [Parcubacteria group bacterium Gr01-1014_56]